MTNRKIDWGGYKPMSDAEKKCASQQQYTITALMMIAVVYKVQKDLLDWDEKMWESPEDFRNRQ